MTLEEYGTPESWAAHIMEALIFKKYATKDS